VTWEWSIEADDQDEAESEVCNSAGTPVGDPEIGDALDYVPESFITVLENDEKCAP
jgi:hypothetical protein